MQQSSNVKAKIRSMKIGVQGSFYPRPADLPQDQFADWQLEESVRHGCTVLQVGFRTLPEDREKILEFKQKAEAHSMGLELTVPGAFGLVGPDASDEARKMFEDGLENARLLNVPVIRTGYGRLNVKTSRFNQEMSVLEHLKSLVPTLEEAGKMAEDAGVLLAVENHCDFTGRELAQLLEMVDSPYVGAALDTANGFTVFCDPNEDIEALAPWTFTTHMKDMKIVDYSVGGHIPMIAIGCTLGEGHVDLSRAIDLLAEHSPQAEGLHLIVEPGWMFWDEERDVLEQQFEYFEKSIKYLQDLQNEKSK